MELTKDEYLEARGLLSRLRAIDSPGANDRALAERLTVAIATEDRMGIASYGAEARRVLAIQIDSLRERPLQSAHS